MELGIDPARHQNDSLQQLALAHGLDLHLLLEVALMPMPGPAEDEGIDWSAAPLDEVADHIVATHHAFIRRILPKLHLLIDKACHDRDRSYAALPRIAKCLDQMEPEMNAHLQLEEDILFPQIRELVWARKTPGAPAEQVDRNIADVGHEYEEAVREIAVLREVTNGYSAPADAPTAYQALMEELSALEADLERHAYLENEVLFPRAVELEKELAAS